MEQYVSTQLVRPASAHLDPWKKEADVTSMVILQPVTIPVLVHI